MFKLLAVIVAAVGGSAIVGIAGKPDAGKAKTSNAESGSGSVTTQNQEGQPNQGQTQGGGQTTSPQSPGSGTPSAK